MDDSQHISLVAQEPDEDKGEGILIKSKVTEVFRYYWSPEEKAFILNPSSSKENVKHVIPQEEVREVGFDYQILDLVIRLKSNYRTTLLYRVCGIGKLLIFVTGIWFISALIILNASRTDNRSGLEIMSGRQL